MYRMIIANRLTDGLVVFLGPEGSWETSIADGRLIGPDEDAEAALEAARKDEDRCLVIEPNLIDVVQEGAGRRPAAIREAIRAFGPTPATRTDTSVGT